MRFARIQRCLIVQKSFFLRLLVFVSLVAAFGAPTLAWANSYQQFLPGATVTIGEFIYDDNFQVLSSDNCTVTVYDPTGALVVNAAAMTIDANSWHHYSFTPPSNTEGIWPAYISCGSLGTGDLVKEDKTFVVSSNIVSSSTVAALVNTNTNSAIATASSSLAAVVNTNTNSIVTAASSSLGASISSVITTLAGIPAAIWSFSGRSLDTFTTLAAAVWSNSTRELTDAALGGGGNLATQSDVITASSSVAAVVNGNTNTQTSGITSSVNAHTDTALNTASSSLASVVNANTNSAIATASSSIVAVVNGNTNTQTSGITSSVNAHTDIASSSIGSIVTAASSSLGASLVSLATSITAIPAAVWANSTRTLTSGVAIAADIWSAATRTLTGASLTSGSLATQSDVTSASSSIVSVVSANTNSATANETTNVNAHTDTALNTASSSIATVVNSNTNTIVTAASSSIGSSLTSLANSIIAIPAAVWANSTRTLTSGVAIAADIWSAATRTLTDASLTSGSLATQSDVITASSSIAAVVNANTNAATSNISSGSAGWTVQMSAVSSVLAGDTYRTTVTMTDQDTLTDAYATPTVTLYDADRNVVVSGVAMTHLSTGVYEYTYAVSNSAAAGTWETVVTNQVESAKTIQTNDYWDVVTTPAQVLIQSMGSTQTPTISANIRITNEGSVDNEYPYEWCVVSNINNACGGGDDVYYASAAKLIHAGENFDTTLTATVPLAGTYYFKVVAYFGTQSSSASRQFTATANTSGGTGGSGGGGGGGGGGGSISPVQPVTATTSALRGDINGDGRVDGIDFSILLAYWETNPPFKNPRVDLNQDGKVDSADFSILLYYWGKHS